MHASCGLLRSRHGQSSTLLNTLQAVPPACGDRRDRLIDCIKAKGPSALIDIADIAQRESFDVIGAHTINSDFSCRSWT